MQDLIDATIEVRRELRVRRDVYPRLVASGKLSQGEADRRMQCLERALEQLLKASGPPDPPPTY